MASWVVLGGHGMLGQDLQEVLSHSGEPFAALGSTDCDIRDLASVRSAVADAEVVVNCAAWTAVDKAEAHEAEAFAINATGARNVALACAESSARYVHISTDYVFDGQAREPYAEDHPQNPQSAYGRTKAAGEWAVRQANPDALVVRTAWLYGEHGPNFVTTMLRLAAERQTLNVVADQIGQPTWARDVADLILRRVRADAAGGYFHATSSAQTSWHGFAREIFRLSGLDPERVQPISTAEYPTPAARPANSVLAHRTITSSGMTPIGHWSERLRVALPTVGAQVEVRQR